MRSTRQSKLLHLPAARTEVAKRSFYYHGCTVYNNLNHFKSLLSLSYYHFLGTYRFNIYILDFYY